MSKSFSDDEIDLLTARARVHNESVGISGILFCFSDRFIQVLEGPGPAAGELYAQIRLDHRHRDIVTVQDVPIEERAYGGWGMRRMRNEDLGAAERALIFHALQMFEPRTLVGPRIRTAGEASTAFMDRIMAHALPARLSIGEAHEVSSLLYAAEVILARDLVLNEAMMEKLAKDAHVSVRLARIYFPTITDLVRACVSRILALEHQAFLAQIVSRRFGGKAELARFITDFVVGSHDRTRVSHGFADQFAQHGGDFTNQTASIIAEAALEAAPREGWPFPDLDATTLAAAIAATDGAARILARHDLAGLADPATRQRLFHTCLSAIGGRRDDEAFMDHRTRPASVADATATVLGDEWALPLWV
jgi:hypothetical protein